MVTGFSFFPALIGADMYDEMSEAMMLQELGEECAKCGRLHYPSELTQGLCDDCLMDLAMEII